jgi:hypothetical protein
MAIKEMSRSGSGTYEVLFYFLFFFKIGLIFCGFGRFLFI